MAWSLRFISGNYQGSEFLLEPNESYIIGSSSDADLVLQSDAMVSPSHARITCQQDRVFLEDLGSERGVYLNGERVAQVAVASGDRILIGTNIMILEDEAQRADASSRESSRADERGMSTNDYHLFTGHISGYIEEVPLPDLVQLLSSSKKTGILELRAEDRGGRIGLYRGRICLAKIDGAESLAQRKALYRLLAWQEGQFSLSTIANDGISEEVLINAANMNAMSAISVESLLLEALEQHDAMAILRASRSEIAFDPNATLSLPERSVGGAHALIEEEHREVYALVCKKPRTVQEILDHGERSDVELQNTMLALLEQGWLEITR